MIIYTLYAPREIASNRPQFDEPSVGSQRWTRSWPRQLVASHPLHVRTAAAAASTHGLGTTTLDPFESARGVAGRVSEDALAMLALF